MTKATVGRSWHISTFVVAAFALTFQLYLVASGDNILDSTAAASRLEQTRRYFSYFTIQSNFLVAVSTFIGWIAFGPRGLVRREDLLPSLIWPVLWLAATLALGPFVGWYPYPFLNVGTIGLGRTLLNCAVISVLFLALGGLALWADRRLSRERATMSA
ncbi:MAG: Pr6Pr family membrane protein [Terrabacter sp.]